MPSGKPGIYGKDDHVVLKSIGMMVLVEELQLGVGLSRSSYSV
ncbi:hypothetical protein [Leptolyngbya sp. BC1307]|nr:hypothetical protein [Leptolyngbya sp. BC1307]